MRHHTFGTAAAAAALMSLPVASPLSAAGNLREADRQSQPGASGVAAVESVDSQGNISRFAIATDFDNNELVPFRIVPAGSVIRIPKKPVCDGPRAPTSNPRRPGQFMLVCSRSNEVAGYDLSSIDQINAIFRYPSGGTDPTAIAPSPDGEAAAISHREGNPVVTIDLGSGETTVVTVIGGPSLGNALTLGMDNYDFGDAGNRFLNYVGSTQPNQVATVGIDRATLRGDVLATTPLGGSPTAIAPAEEIPNPGTGSLSARSPAGRGRLLYVGVRSSQAGVQDQILTYRVGSAGELALVGSTPAGTFLTDIEVTYDRLFAVTVTPAGRDEVRAYRRRGVELVLDATMEMPESAPSFKQIAAAPSDGRVTNLFVTGYQGGWLRSILYTRDDDPSCAAASEAFCANGNRFEVSVDWRVPTQNRSGKGIAAPITSDTGAFWFFSSNNIELVIKVVDGRAFNNFFWVFYGALSDVAYTITVTDTATGRVQRYANVQGSLASVADVTAFPGGTVLTAGASLPAIRNDVAERVRELSADVTRLLSPASSASARAAFLIRIDWRVPSQGTSGVGRGVILTSDTAYFWFFSPSNVEVVIKVVDGRAVNNHYWVFYGALSDVEYTITVTNTDTGVVRTYFNPSGTIASVADVLAF